MSIREISTPCRTDLFLCPHPYRETNVCAFSAIRGEIVDIPDVYHSAEFDFGGPKRYDALTANDRPYKRLSQPLEAIHILRDMAKNDEADPEIVEYLYEALKAEGRLTE